MTMQEEKRDVVLPAQDYWFYYAFGPQEIKRIILTAFNEDIQRLYVVADIAFRPDGGIIVKAEKRIGAS